MPHQLRLPPMSGRSGLGRDLVSGGTEFLDFLSERYGRRICLPGLPLALAWMLMLMLTVPLKNFKSHSFQRGQNTLIPQSSLAHRFTRLCITRDQMGGDGKYAWFQMPHIALQWR